MSTNHQNGRTQRTMADLMPTIEEAVMTLAEQDRALADKDEIIRQYERVVQDQADAIEAQGEQLAAYRQLAHEQHQVLAQIRRDLQMAQHHADTLYINRRDVYLPQMPLKLRTAQRELGNHLRLAARRAVAWFETHPAVRS